MHILFLHQYYCSPQGWGNDRSRELMQAWQAAGHQVTCITSTAYFPELQEATRVTWQTHAGVQVHILPVPYRQQMSKLGKALSFLHFGWAALQAALALPRADVIIASVTPPTVGYAGYLASKLHGVPLVLEVVDVWPDVPEGMGILRNRTALTLLHGLNARVYAHARQIITLSPGMQAQICAHGVPPHKVHVSLNGTDTTRFFPIAQEKKDDNAPVRLIYTGALGQANAVSQLVRLMPRLTAQASHPIHLDIYGWGQEAPAIQQLIVRQGMANVQLHPPVPKAQLNDILNSADIALCVFAPHPVLEANSANKFYDYLAAGLPVVLNYRGWQADLLATHDCGLCAPMGDEDAFARAILRLVDAAPLRQEMGRQARALAVATFDRKQLAADYLPLLTRL